MTCIRLDATVTPAHSDKELAEAEFQRLRPSSAARGTAITPASRWPWMMRRGTAGSATPPRITCRYSVTAIAALPPAFRRQADGDRGRGRGQPRAGHPPGSAGRPAAGYQLTYSVGWELGAASEPRSGWSPRTPGRSPSISAGEVRERRADDACADRAAGTAVLDRGSARHRADRAAARGPGGDQLDGWPARCGSSPAASGRTPAPS